MKTKRLFTTASAAFAGLAMCAGAAAAQDKLAVKWGVAINASLSHAIAPMLELDTELQEKHGLEFTTVDFRGGVTQCIAGVLADEAATCQNGITAGMNAMAQGAEMKGFIQQIGQITEVTISTKAMEAAGLTKDSPVEERLAALKGLRIAGPGPGSSTYYLLEDILSQADLTVADIQFQPLVDTAAMNASIANDRIDGAIWSVGGLSPSQADGSAVRWISLAGNDVPHLKSVPNVATYAKTEWVEENQELLKRVQAAFVEVVEKLKADPFGYAQAFKDKYLPNIDEATWQDNLPQAIESYIADMEGTKEGWDFWVSYLDETSDADFTNVYYDQGYVQVSKF